MQNYSIEKMRRILKKNGYSYKRTKGSHEMYSDGTKTIPIVYPVTNALTAKRIFRINNINEYV